MSAPAVPKGSVPHVPEFDGLRGYLAWWVVAFHMYQDAGLHKLNSKLLSSTIGQGWGAVPIFFILSGFVIALTEGSRREPYPVFLGSPHETDCKAH